MKVTAAIALTLGLALSGVAGAATYGSDKERRDQNREEALAKWRADHGNLRSDRGATTRTSTAKPTLRERTHNGASAVRGFTHRQAEKARNFSERQDRRYGKQTTINTSPEGGGK